MAGKRSAEDALERTPLERANLPSKKKRRLSAGNENGATASEAAASPKPEKIKKKEKKKKSSRLEGDEDATVGPSAAARDTMVEASGAFGLTAVRASPLMKDLGSKTKKQSNNIQERVVLDSKELSPLPVDRQSALSRREKKLARKEIRKRNRQEAKASEKVQKAHENEEAPPANSAVDLSLVVDTKFGQQEKQRKRQTSHSGEKTASSKTSPKLTDLSPSDYDALLRQVRQQIKEEEAAKEAKKLRKLQKKQKKAAAAAAATAEGSNQTHQVEAEQNAEVDLNLFDTGKMEIATTESEDQPTESQMNTRGLVGSSSFSAGSARTSDSPQVVPMANALESVAIAGNGNQSSHAPLQDRPRNDWSISEGVGAALLNIDPIFTPDGHCILVPFATCVKVYSRKTSLLLRILAVSRGEVSSMALAMNAGLDILLIGTSSGRLEKWRWTDAHRLAMYAMSSSIYSISSVSTLGPPETNYVFTIEERKEKSGTERQMRLHELHVDNANNQARTILRTSDSVNKAKVYCGGRLIVATSPQRLVVGVLSQDLSSLDLGKVQYSWYELDCPDTIYSFDVKVMDSQVKIVDADIAIGSSGPIYIYQNLVSQLRKISKRKATTRPSVQKLHWHRYAVKALRYSRDGNYLVSGGIETVLCSWQLDTGRRQDLPHLTAPIEALTISPDGASYAVVLGNNSLVVLSTLDFKPTFAVSGPAWPRMTATDGSPLNVHSFPAVVRKESSPTQVLLAVPSSTTQRSSLNSTNAVYLQTCDARTGIQLEKQALSRTNVTDRVSDPNGRFVDEPNILHMDISKDGMWLATVEEWRPPSRDLLHVSNKHGKESFAHARKEVFLKVWSRNEDTKTWELTSRIDGPHSEGPFAPHDLFDIVADARGFITVGSDGQVKFWRQKTRLRNGLEVKNQTGVVLTNWVCARSISLPSAPAADAVPNALIAARLAISSDDSLLVTVLKSTDSTLVYFTDLASGKLINVRSDIGARVLIDAAIVGGYLVILSEHLLVWNIVEDALQFSYSLKGSNLPFAALRAHSHLASHDTTTFAIAVPNQGGTHTELAIFDPRLAQPLMTKQLNQLAGAVLPLPTTDGFIFVDSLNQIRQINPPSRVQAETGLLTPEPELSLSEVPVKLSNLLLEQKTVVADEGAPARESGEAVNRQSTSVAPHSESDVTQAKLAEIFEAHNTLTQGSLMSMFDNVAKLVIGRRKDLS